MIQTTVHSVTATNRIPGLVMTDHEFEVPLDYDNPTKGTIKVFAREVVTPEHENDRSRPWMIFFQGGPGFPSPRPTSRGGWLSRALEKYRVLLLDQRGTGLSSPITFQTLGHFESANETAEYLTHFRADAIVKDAEAIRKVLLGDTIRWTGLGQSYGGFCLIHYLSEAPDGLDAAIITGGIPPLSANIDDIYRATYKRCKNRNERYYERYPGDAALVSNIVKVLNRESTELPSGGVLTPERFQQLGIQFGMSDGFENLHFMLEESFVDVGTKRELSHTFLRNLEAAQSYECNPIYAFLHEAIYCQKAKSAWSAERVRSEFPDFAWDKNEGPIYFTGEMIYPWMFDQYPRLRPIKEAAKILAEKDDWGILYDRRVLHHNKVPVVAAVYYDDMYVETAFSEESAANIGNTKLWVTNEYDHNGLRQDGAKILDRLFAMLGGEV